MIIVVSIVAAITRKMKHIISNLATSLTTNQNFKDFFLMIAADIKPPAIAPMK